MIIPEASKEPRKVKAAALFNELKHGFARVLRFSSNEKYFDKVYNSSKQNERLICKDIEKVIGVKYTKFNRRFLPGSSEEHCVKSWMDRIDDGRLHDFQQKSALYKSPRTISRACLTTFLTNGRRTYGRPLHPTAILSTICSTLPRPTATSMPTTWSILWRLPSWRSPPVDKNMMARAWDSSCSCLEMVFCPRSGYTE